ncbi:M23 family metallopeptidase, partial [Candidatus Sumerlaeota bacterium]|nr:M23 family metallopeptidase [Candidatus Sumerlaeota bacterium]
VPLVDSIIKPKSRPAAKSSKINITAKERIVYNGKVVDVASLGSEGATKEKPGRFVMPVNGSLSSSFGYRKQPIGGARKYHQGVDIQAPIRSPIVASASGTVIEVSRSWAKGLNLLIKHSGGYETAYFHLSSATVKEGQKVNQGQLIGYEGMTGVTTGPHVHFEIHKDGQPLDPALFIKELAN